MDISILTGAIILGFLLGIKHATDADHVVAVSTIVSEYRNPWRSIWVGVSWALGHTTPLLIAGTIILLVKRPFPQQLSLLLEFGVGIMLVVLGLQVFWNLRRLRLHAHSHLHDVGRSHAHLHSHALSPEHQNAGHEGFHLVGKPFFRLKSYVVGVVHGLAGSAAIMLLVLTTIPSFWSGMVYIGVFGVGTALSMGLITLVLGIPFSVSGRFERLNRAIQVVAGSASIVFGIVLMYEIAVVEGLFLRSA
ncbi:MAG: urease accessory protein UreH [Chloroflexi bacterium]|nr:urease accessory protein UreH [Chloroflexota bacterium]